MTPPERCRTSQLFPMCYFGIGSSIGSSSQNDTLPVLPLIRYWTFNCLGVPNAGSGKQCWYRPGKAIRVGLGELRRYCRRVSVTSSNLVSAPISALMISTFNGTGGGGALASAAGPRGLEAAGELDSSTL